MRLSTAAESLRERVSERVSAYKVLVERVDDVSDAALEPLRQHEQLDGE